MSITRYKGEDHAPYFDNLLTWAQREVFAYLPVPQPFPDAEREQPGVWVAGGSVCDYFLDRIVNDYDIFFENSTIFDETCNLLKASGFKAITENKYHTVLFHPSVNKTFDLIGYRMFSNAEEVIDSFDFTISMCAVGLEEICCDDAYFEHLATKSLVIKNMTKPTSVLRRLPKYIEKGFSVDDRELSKLVDAISNLDADDPKQNIFKWIEDGHQDLKFREYDFMSSNPQSIPVLTAAPVFPPVKTGKANANITPQWVEKAIKKMKNSGGYGF